MASIDVFHSDPFPMIELTAAVERNPADWDRRALSVHRQPNPRAGARLAGCVHHQTVAMGMCGDDFWDAPVTHRDVTKT